MIRRAMAAAARFSAILRRYAGYAASGLVRGMSTHFVMSMIVRLET